MTSSAERTYSLESREGRDIRKTLALERIAAALEALQWNADRKDARDNTRENYPLRVEIVGGGR